jgi:hypothetical protein
MSRVLSILSKAREELGDANNTRFTDSKLLEHLNDGIKDFILSTKSLKERLYVELASNVAIYDISKYALFVERVEYMNTKIDTLSFTELDSINTMWQYETGNVVKAITFEHQSKGSFRIYPRLNTVNNNIVSSSDYGILVDFSLDDDIVGIPSIIDVEQNLQAYLVLYVIKKPNIITLTTPDEELELDELYDKAFVHYIKAQCLRNDSDSNNRQFGNEELSAYAMYVVNNNKDFALDNQVSGDRIIQYKGFM